MLYLLYGTNEEKAREKAHALIDPLLKRQPDAAYFKLNDETTTHDSLAEHIGSQGLFSARSIVLCDHVFRSDDTKEILLDRVKEIAESENIFIILEGELNKKELSKFEKYAEKVQEFSLKPKAEHPEPGFNIFSLTEALGKRDRELLWARYQEALSHGVPLKDIHPVLFWQVKTLLLVEQGATQGIKPFVVGKAKGFLNNYSHKELVRLSSELVRLYHDTRRGMIDFDIAMEQFVLSI